MICKGRLRQVEWLEMDVGMVGELIEEQTAILSEQRHERVHDRGRDHGEIRFQLNLKAAFEKGSLNKTHVLFFVHFSNGKLLVCVLRVLFKGSLKNELLFNNHTSCNFCPSATRATQSEVICTARPPSANSPAAMVGSLVTKRASSNSTISSPSSRTRVERAFDTIRYLNGSDSHGWNVRRSESDLCESSSLLPTAHICCAPYRLLLVMICGRRVLCMMHRAPSL